MISWSNNSDPSGVVKPVYERLTFLQKTSFEDLNVRGICSNIHISANDKLDDFGFPIVYFSWLSGDVPRFTPYGIYISQLVRFAGSCTSVFDFHSNYLQFTSKLLTRGYRYHKLRKTFEKFFGSYSELLSKIGAISFQKYVPKGITHPVIYGDFVCKLKRVKRETNFISFAANFLTILFSQCHIYFNYKGHTRKSNL